MRIMVRVMIVRMGMIWMFLHTSKVFCCLFFFCLRPGQLHFFFGNFIQFYFVQPCILLIVELCTQTSYSLLPMVYSLCTCTYVDCNDKRVFPNLGRRWARCHQPDLYATEAFPGIWKPGGTSKTKVLLRAVKCEVILRQKVKPCPFTAHEVKFCWPIYTSLL